MSLPPFNYHQPASLAEACRMLRDYSETSALLAGGTDLLVKMRNRGKLPADLVSLSEVPEMQDIIRQGEKLVIGACCTAAQLAESEIVCSLFPALASAAGHIGSPPVRNLGTLGGNIMTTSPSADLPPALMAYKAQVRLQSAEGERYLAVDEIFRHPGATNLSSNDILAEVHLDLPPELSAACFFKLGTRNALQISIVNGACFLALNPQTRKIEQARVALGAVAPTHVRAFSAESILVGQHPETALFDEAGRAAVNDCQPIDDLRGSALYRRDMVHMLTKRTLQSALDHINAANH